MPQIPCPDQFSDCVCVDAESPFRNFSSELPDIPSFFSIGYSRPALPLGTNFGRLGCATLCENETSQEAANLCAIAQAYLCTTGTWQSNGGGAGPGPPVPPPQNPRGGTRVRNFFNSSQTATVFCPDGLPFTYTVPAGRFVDSSQLGANTKALTYAQQRALQLQLCLSDIVARACSNTSFNAVITASGAFSGSDNFWSITSGFLPPGLIITAGGTQAAITGTPTVPGIYQFTINVTDVLGDTMSKPYTLRIMGITNPVPFQAGQTGTPYNEFILSAGVLNPIYSLESGALPDGLTLDPTGVIFGTPTVGAVFNFVLGVTEAGTGITCLQPTSIEIIAAGQCVQTPTETFTQSVFINCDSIAFSTGDKYLLVYDGLTASMDLYDITNSGFVFLLSGAVSIFRSRAIWSSAANEWVDVGTDVPTQLEVHFNSYNKTTLAVTGTSFPGSEPALIISAQPWALNIRPSTGMCYSVMRVVLWSYDSVARIAGPSVSLLGLGGVFGSIGVNDSANRIYVPLAGGIPVIQIRNATTLALIGSFALPAQQVHGCIFNPDNGLLYIGGNDAGGDGGDVIWVMDPVTGIISTTIRLLTNIWATTSLTFDPATFAYHPGSHQIYAFASCQRNTPPANGGVQVICADTNTKVAFFSNSPDPTFGMFVGDVIYADVPNTIPPSTPTIFSAEALHNFIRGYTF